MIASVSFRKEEMETDIVVFFHPYHEILAENSVTMTGSDSLHCKTVTDIKIEGLAEVSERSMSIYRWRIASCVTSVLLFKNNCIEY